MIKFFNSNIPVSVFFAVILVFIFTGQIFLVPKADYFNFYNWYISIFDWVTERKWTATIVTGFVIIISGFVINKTFNKTNFYLKTTALPFFIYISILSTFQGFNFQTTIFIDLIFAFAILILLGLDQNKTATHVSFVTGFILGIGFVFSYWTIPVALVIFYGLLVSKAFVLKEWIVSILGMFIPVIYLWSYSYLFLNKTTITLSKPYGEIASFQIIDVLSFIILGVIVLISTFGLFKHLKFVSIVGKKQANILIFFFIVTFATSITTYFIFHIFYLIFIIPLVLLVSIYITNAKQNKFIDFLFTILIIINLLRIFIFS